MEAIALRPRKATEIIDAAIEVYRRNPIHFLLLAAMVRVPWLIVQIIFLAPREGDADAIGLSVLIGVGSLLTTILMSGFVIYMASELYLGRETDAFDTVRKVAPRVPAVFVASLLQTVAIGLGLLLFLFPAVWVTGVLFAVIPAVVLERKGPFAAFDRSGSLSSRVKTHVLSALGLIVLIRVIVEGGGGLLATVIPIPELRYVAVTAVSMVMYPLFGIATTLIYYDIRIRKEGFDIEMMAGPGAVTRDAVALPGLTPPMPMQGVEQWSAGAVHDTVGALLRDAAYHRSFWSSVAGRLLMELGRFIMWVIEAARGIPGGRTTVLLGLAVVLLLVLGRLFLAAEWSDELLFRRKGGGARSFRIDPWTESERLAAAGDYMGAAHALYQAVLRRISASERIRVHASKTSGDYSRDLRRRGSPLAATFQRFGRRFDRVVFGAGVCTPEDFAAMLADAMAIPDRQAAA